MAARRSGKYRRGWDRSLTSGFADRRSTAHGGVVAETGAKALPGLTTLGVGGPATDVVSTSTSKQNAGAYGPVVARTITTVRAGDRDA